MCWCQKGDEFECILLADFELELFKCVFSILLRKCENSKGKITKKKLHVVLKQGYNSGSP